MSDAQVISSLEAHLPQWPGPQPVIAGPSAIEGVPGSGWWGEGAPDYQKSAGPIHARMKAVIGAIDAHGTDVLNLPPVTTIPYLSFASPLSYPSVRINANAGRYKSLRDLDLDMSRLFEKARRFHPLQSTQYGKVIVLQRLYNALTAPYPLRLPPTGVPDPSPTCYASLPAGPGNAKSQHETSTNPAAGFGVTTFRVGTKDRIFTTEARHKGMAYKVGDFVHLVNPDDAAKPIIGQIFKTFVPTKGFRTHHVTVCWYYRPEQTVHTEDRTFYEHEVFKTSHFCDHPVEDLIERIGVQFYVKWIRGRSKAPEWYPGWPMYVCHSRYNDKLWATVRIKNWGSCIPDELRQTDFMAVVPFDRQVEPPVNKSPFLLGIQGPGFFGEPRGKTTEEDEEREPPPPPPVVKPPQPPPTQYRPPVNWSSSPRSVVAVLGGAQIVDQVAVRDVLPIETTRLFEKDARGQVLWFSGPPISVPQLDQPTHSVEYLNHMVGGGAIKRQRLIAKDASRGDDEEEDVKRAAWWAEEMSEQEVIDALLRV